MSSGGSQKVLEALQVTGKALAPLRDKELDELMNQLFGVQCQSCGLGASDYSVNAESRAADGGRDGWTAAPPELDEWLGESETCWQFKTGSAGEPAQLAKEVSKEIPKKTLKDGGRFVVVALGANAGQSAEDRRKNAMVTKARLLKIPTEKIDVIGCERLASWINNHPPVARFVTNTSPDVLSLGEALGIGDHKAFNWSEGNCEKDIFRKWRPELDPTSGNGHGLHLHIYGPPGAGKTRLALELCSGASWKRFVLCQMWGSKDSSFEIIARAVSNNAIRLVLVIDKVSDDDLANLGNSAGRAEGRIKIISIGECLPTDMSRTGEQFIGKRGSDDIRRIVRGWYPNMTDPAVGCVADIADGYLRPARIASTETNSGSGFDPDRLSRRDDILGFRKKVEDYRREYHWLVKNDRV